MNSLIECLDRIARANDEIRSAYFELGRLSVTITSPEHATVKPMLAEINPAPQKARPLNSSGSASKSTPAAAPPFFVYLVAKRKLQTPLGELIRQIEKDDSFPKDRDENGMIEYVKKNKDYPDKGWRTLQAARAGYCRKFKN